MTVERGVVAVARVARIEAVASPRRALRSGPSWAPRRRSASPCRSCRRAGCSPLREEAISDRAGRREAGDAGHRRGVVGGRPGRLGPGPGAAVAASSTSRHRTGEASHAKVSHPLVEAVYFQSPE